MTVAAIYARVSSDRQREENTIASQTATLIDFARSRGYQVPTEWVFEDEGYSGASLVRPGLERVRDLAAEGQIEAVLVHAPDRLSRRYAYQILLIEELARHGVETVFIKAPQVATAEDQLLVQFQGMIAEYERAQILERSRRGKRHRARQGRQRCALSDGRHRSAEDARRRPSAAALTVGSLIFRRAGVAERGGSRVHERWARLRFSVIGAAAGRTAGEGRAARGACSNWRPANGATRAPARRSASASPRWSDGSTVPATNGMIRSACCAASGASDAGEQASMTPALRQALLAQYGAHKSWSAQLHHDNLVALAETRSELRPVPSYATVRRFLAAHGLTRRRADDDAPDRRRAGGRGAARGARGARLRGRVCERALALGLSSRFAQGADAARRMANADPVRRARRPLAAGLPSAMVSGRECREHRARPVAGDAEARPAARRHERQRQPR